MSNITKFKNLKFNIQKDNYMMKKLKDKSFNSQNIPTLIKSNLTIEQRQSMYI